eukprot:12389545-Alexandrium_andersonii.AAC.1
MTGCHDLNIPRLFRATYAPVNLASCAGGTCRCAQGRNDVPRRRSAWTCAGKHVKPEAMLTMTCELA